MICYQKNISKKIKLVIILILCVLLINIFSFFNQNVNNEVSNDQIRLQTIYISEDTIWNTIGSPYIINETIVIEQSATLTIEPGVQVLFNESTSLIIDGILNATGTSTNPIIFTSNSSTPTKGDWNSIKIRGINSIISNAIISYADKGVEIDGGLVKIINSTIFENNYGILGFNLHQGDLIIQNNSIHNSLYENLRIQDLSGNIVNYYINNNKFFHGSGPAGFNCIDLRPSDHSKVFFENNEVFNNSRGGIRIAYCDLDELIFQNNSIYRNRGTELNDYGVIFQGIRLKNPIYVQYNEIYDNGNNGMVFENVAGQPCCNAWIDNVSIQYNKIYNNSNDGIKFSLNKITSLIFQHNIISNNSNYGVSVDSHTYIFEHLSLHNNEISNNTIGLYFKNWFENEYKVNYNNIINNSLYSIYCAWEEPSKHMDIKNNWWGTNESSEIDDMIFDYYDNTIYAKVDFLPILTNPVNEIFSAIAPQFNNLQINDTAILVGDHVNISIEVTDNVKIDSVWIYINNYACKMTSVNDTDTFYYIFIPLIYNSTYNFIISSNDTSGLINTFNGYLAMESLPQPFELFFSVSGFKITLTWTSSEFANEYSVYLSESYINQINSNISILGGNITGFSFLTTLTNGEYYLVVEAYNEYGSIVSNCVFVEINQSEYDNGDDNDYMGNNLFLIIPIIIGIAITGVFGAFFIRSYFKKEKIKRKLISIPQTEELQIKTEEVKEEYKKIEIKQDEMLSSQEFLCKNCGNLVQITDYLKSRKKIFCEKCGVLITLPEE